MLDVKQATADLTKGTGSAVPALEVRDLAKRYGTGPMILNGVSMSICTGERVALIGSNGSGKTTLLRCLIGLHAPTAGSIAVHGTDLRDQPRRRVRQATGFVFQRPSLVRRRSVLANVCHGMLGTPGSWRGFGQAIAPQAWRDAGMEALDAVGLANRALDRADALSGGQQQRVAIARALVRQPSLLIADEPASALDPAAGEDVMHLFSTLAAERGITLLFTSHDMVQAQGHSDRMVALRTGQVAFDRASSSLIAHEIAEVFQ